MTHEKACGAIIIDGEKALLVFQQNGFWGFPKGHVELGETELETAVREVKEEVGLDVLPDPDKRLEFSYHIKDKDIHKTVVLFLATLDSAANNPKRQEEEIAEVRWVPFGEVENLLTFPEWRAVWREARETWLK